MQAVEYYEKKTEDGVRKGHILKGTFFGKQQYRAVTPLGVHTSASKAGAAKFLINNGYVKVETKKLQTK